MSRSNYLFKRQRYLFACITLNSVEESIPILHEFFNLNDHLKSYTKPTQRFPHAYLSMADRIPESATAEYGKIQFSNGEKPKVDYVEGEGEGGRWEVGAVRSSKNLVLQKTKAKRESVKRYGVLKVSRDLNVVTNKVR